MDRVCKGRVCYGPSLSWAEFVMGRVVQLPLQWVRALDFYPGDPGSNPISNVGFFQTMHHFLVTNFHIRKNRLNWSEV